MISKKFMQYTAIAMVRGCNSQNDTQGKSNHGQAFAKRNDGDSGRVTFRVSRDGKAKRI